MTTPATTFGRLPPRESDNVLFQLFRTGHALGPHMARVVDGTGVSPDEYGVLRRIRIGRLPFDVIFAAGAVWATNSADGTVSRISPARNRVVATIRTGGTPAGLSFAAGSVWVANGARVQRLDP